MSDVPSLAEVLDAAVARATREIRVALPGRVESYDPVSQTASIQILISDSSVGPDARLISKPIAQLNDVPIQFYGSGETRYTLPVKPGHLVKVVFCSSAISRWKVSGALVDPQDPRRHSLADGVAEPGLHAGDPPTSAPEDVGCLHGEHWIGGDGMTDDNKIVVQSTLDQFMTVLENITTPAPVAAVCSAIHTALQLINWPASFTASSAKAK